MNRDITKLPKWAQAEMQHLQDQVVQSQQERVYLECLKMTLEHCKNWSFGDERINDAEGYCKLAKIFAQHSIRKIKQL